MAHPSSIVRGKVLALPARDLPRDSTQLELALTTAMRMAERSTQPLISMSEVDPSGVRVLIVSGSKERSLRRWEALVSPVLAAHGVHGDWAKALVLQAAATRPDHG